MLAVLFASASTGVCSAGISSTRSRKDCIADNARERSVAGGESSSVVLRTSLIPIVTLFGLDFASVLGGGAILTRGVFDLHRGRPAAHFIRSTTRPAPPIMGVTLYGAFFITIFSVFVDPVYLRASTRGSGRRNGGAAAGGPGSRCGVHDRDGVVAVGGVSFELDRGKVLGIVGESGSGKSVTAMTIIGLTRDINASFRGEVNYQGRNLSRSQALEEMQNFTRQRDRDDLPGSDDLAESGVSHQRTDRRRRSGHHEPRR